LFYGNKADSNRRLFWFAYNLNKRGIPPDIEKKDGRYLFLELALEAYFIIESFPVNYIDKLNLGYSALGEINPHIIMTSITPFSPTGPYKILRHRI
jgi:crotonobetainyl-CoA:carnitine CoA-transferase CaiB-like acyl-CoA transferase